MQATRLVFEDSKVESSILTILYRMLGLGMRPLQGDFQILEIINISEIKLVHGRPFNPCLQYTMKSLIISLANSTI